MADINNLTVVSPQQPIEVDVDEVLRAYGLDNVAQTSTIIQQTANNNNIINIPTNNMLEPPSVDSVVQDSLSILEEEVPFSSIQDVQMEAPHADAVTVSEEIEETEELLNSDSHIEGLDISTDNDFSLTTTEQVEKPELSTEELLSLLPVNSKAFEIDDSVSRFSGASWFKAIQETVITLAGIGGIGRIW